jgi:hypothetical protein
MDSFFTYKDEVGGARIVFLHSVDRSKHINMGSSRDGVDNHI